MVGLPHWMETRAGRSAVLLVAPHGGLSDRDLLLPAAGPVRSNDFHTASLAREIGERLDASWLVNASMDRNELDLNRLGEVVARAPWFLDAIAGELEEILSRHGMAEVVFVHGWHVVQPKCDIGIGAPLGDASDAPRVAERLTVPLAYLRGRLEAFRARCRAVGIDTAYGERWPAAHRENPMQLFRQTSRRELAGAAARIAGWARAGRVVATQLELGAAVRWPGPTRQALVDAVSDSWCSGWSSGHDVGSHAPPGSSDGGASAGEPHDIAGGRMAGWFLQAHDATCGPGGLGLTAAMGPLGEGRTGARLLLFTGGQAIALFTGESRSASTRVVGGLHIEASAGATSLRFAGPMLLARDGAVHFRSEASQIHARIVQVAVELEVAAIASTDLAEVVGLAEIDGRKLSIRTTGFLGVPPLRGGPASSGRATRLAAAFGPELGMTLTVRSGSTKSEPDGFRHSGAGREAVRVDAPLASPVTPPAPFVVPASGSVLECHPTSHLSFLRPSAGGGYSRVTLGTANYALDRRLRGSGLYEHVEPVGAPASAEPA